MISFKKSANESSELKNLWLTCFDEDKRAVDLFFKKAIKFTDVYCAKWNDKIVSALYCINANLNGEKAHYIFGVATLPEFRCRGIMSDLMEYALNDAIENGYSFSVLFPANDSLYEFYEKFGYKALCTAKSRIFTRNELEKLENFKSCKRNILLQSNDFIEFASEYYEIYGIKTVREKNCFALIDENEDSADVFYSSYTDFDRLKTLVLSNTKAEKIIFTGSSIDKLYANQESNKFGMIKSLNNTEIPNDVYIGITLN